MTIRNKLSGKEQVDAFMEGLEHPFKAEIEKLRGIILQANNKLEERVKWNAPSFYYQRDMAALNLRAKGYVQIIFIFYEGNMIDSPLLLGTWKDRREARFFSLDDIDVQTEALQTVVNQWVSLAGS
ncbi:DUF1801 domain-containing protein [Pedobacter rhizosphaerae]|uniref:YdhG-like domain-containing protein n=1 Tax=Pedobacter rhizosphaerae TaxID=390241 RepID=A0A1H9QXL2_9SPHI|nr:DUF1801 domain-containing protein [Pedobacter rhizosphaerae]SER64965.1 hypothetical protein SAMN04488023_11322 [Pedobacter rhizosphaerae]